MSAYENWLLNPEPPTSILLLLFLHLSVAEKVRVVHFCAFPNSAYIICYALWEWMGTKGLFWRTFACCDFLNVGDAELWVMYFLPQLIVIIKLSWNIADWRLQQKQILSVNNLIPHSRSVLIGLQIIFKINSHMEKMNGNLLCETWSLHSILCNVVMFINCECKFPPSTPSLASLLPLSIFGFTYLNIRKT